MDEVKILKPATAATVTDVDDDNDKSKLGDKLDSERHHGENQRCRMEHEKDKHGW